MRKSYAVYILGAGRCGRALAVALEEAGHRVIGLWNRTESGAKKSRLHFPHIPIDTGDVPDSFRGAEVVWVTVPDRNIADLSHCLSGISVALHASGALTAEVLRHPHGADHVASAHPIQSFPARAVGSEHMHGVYFGLQGDSAALHVAKQLVEDMRATVFQVHSAVEKALYHAACCVASNSLVAMMERATRLFSASGVPRQDAFNALLPLVRGTLSNLQEAQRPLDALTGPVARGDVDVISAHLAAIRSKVPEESIPYETLVRLISNTAQLEHE